MRSESFRWAMTTKKDTQANKDFCECFLFASQIRCSRLMDARSVTFRFEIGFHLMESGNEI